MINKISLSRLMDGGAAIFALTKRNHHIDIMGRLTRIPLVRAMLRVWVCSYVILARLNRAEDTSPCAIIIANLPYRPILVFDITPAIRRPMCPTDE